MRRLSGHRYKTAIYCRLSKDDNLGKTESMSIANQKQLLLDYVMNNKWDLVGVYVDDGFTGTNFDRPDFKRMIRDIDDGVINCVVTKDLSRLGRNYSMTGYYIDEYFIEHGVRFIAINDSVDTDQETNDFAAFHNVINEFYPKEISRKVRQVKKANAERGRHQGGRPPYGYMKDPEDKYKLVIDPEPARIIKRIFNDYVKHGNARKIAEDLNRDKVLSPAAYYYKLTKKAYGQKEPSKILWNSNSITRILHNQIYRGNMVSGTRTTPSFKSKKIILKHPSEWIIVEGTHEALIDDALWYAAEEMHTSPRKRAYHHKKRSKKYLFKGIIFCKECGARLVGSIRHGRKDYRCSTYNTGGNTACTTHSIREDYLINAVREDLKHFGNVPEEKRLEMAVKIIAKARESGTDSRSELEKELNRNKLRIEEIGRISRSMYEDKVSGLITSEMFAQMTSEYKIETDECKKSIKRVETKLGQIESIEKSAGKWLDAVYEYLKMNKLDQDLVLELIEKIEVSHVSGSTLTPKKVTIYYKFLGPISGSKQVISRVSKESKLA